MVLADDLRDNRGAFEISQSEGKKGVSYIIPLICVGASQLPISPLRTGRSRFRFDSEEATREPEMVNFGVPKSSVHRHHAYLLWPLRERCHMLNQVWVVFLWILVC